MVGNNTLNTEETAYHYLQNFDFGLTAGGGVNVRLSPGVWLNIDATYLNGLLDVSEGKNLPNASSDWNANRNLGLNVGVTFPIGGR
jgi:hypothetical protein